MWELGHKEKGWALKNQRFQIVVLEKTPESPLDCKEIKPVNLKGNEPRMFIGKTDAEAEAPILWPSDVESNHWKRSWGWERLRARREVGDRIKWLDGITDSMDMSLSKLWEILKDKEAWSPLVHRVPKGQTQLSIWKTTTTTNNLVQYIINMNIKYAL